MVHASAVCSLKYEALGKFREHSRVALGYASSNSYASFIHSKLPHASYLNDYMLTYEPIVTKKEKNLFQFKLSIGNLIHSLFCFLLMEGWLFYVWHHLKQFFFFIRLIVFLFCFSLLVTSLAKIGLQASLVACCVFTIWHLSVISISFHLTISPLNHSCKSWE